MSKQLHKNCTDEQVKSLLENYLKKLRLILKVKQNSRTKARLFSRVKKKN